MKYSFRISYLRTNEAHTTYGEDFHCTTDAGMREAILDALKQMPGDLLTELEKLARQVRTGMQ